VEIPENVRGSHEWRAISVAKKAAGTEMINNPSFKPHSSWAKLIMIDPSKLDFTTRIPVEECRVWVLEKAEWR
jgi:hypothetical protein